MKRRSEGRALPHHPITPSRHHERKRHRKEDFMETAASTMRHIYNLSELDRIPAEPCSALVTPRGTLGGGVSAGAAGADGAMLTGLRAHVALLRQPAGTGSAVHSHPSERYNYVLRGTLIADLDGQVMRV